MSSDSRSPYDAHSGSVRGSYFPSAFAEQPVDIDQVEDVWIDDSEPTSYMTRNADIMYDTRSLPPRRSRIILGDEFGR